MFLRDCDRKRTFSWLAGVLGILTLAGCQPAEPTVDSSKSISAEEVGRKVDAAWGAMLDYAFDRKEEYSQQAEKQSEQWSQKIDDLRRRAESLTGQAKESVEPLIQQLEAQKAQLAEQLPKVKDASKDAWQQTKEGMHKVFDELDQTYNRATEAFDAAMKK